MVEVVILDETGHSTYQLTVEEAREKVAMYLDKGWLVAVDGELVRTADVDIAERVFIFPPLVGG